MGEVKNGMNLILKLFQHNVDSNDTLPWVPVADWYLSQDEHPCHFLKLLQHNVVYKDIG
jgi:hypothetical protein